MSPCIHIVALCPEEHSPVTCLRLRIDYSQDISQILSLLEKIFITPKIKAVVEKLCLAAKASGRFIEEDEIGADVDLDSKGDIIQLRLRISTEVPFPITENVEALTQAFIQRLPPP
jgi:hypothetical protein